MFELVAAGWPGCHLTCARRYWVVVYYSCPRFTNWPGHRSFDDDPGPRFYLSLS